MTPDLDIRMKKYCTTGSLWRKDVDLKIIPPKFKLNPWHYSSEEPRPTEAVATIWQYGGPCG